MNILSLFDGMSCGQIALKRLGIPIENYYASEIDKHAIQITQKNHPNTIQLGDVTHVTHDKMEKIDLLIGGSPCQGFSFAGKKLNFEDPRSKLFFEYVRLLEECKPKYFLLENVKMEKEHQDVISQHLGMEPIEINSALVSAQNRKRLYWTNIPGAGQPHDLGISLKDIVHENSKEFNSHENGLGISLSDYTLGMTHTLEILNKEIEKGKIIYLGEDENGNGIYKIHNEDIIIKKELDINYVPENPHVFGCLTPKRVNKRQNGQRFNKGNKFYTLTAQDRHGLLVNGYLRRITPIECERLQTVPDNYTEGVKEAHRYKMLGNGWTVDVVKHLFNGIRY